MNSQKTSHIQHALMAYVSFEKQGFCRLKVAEVVF